MEEAINKKKITISRAMILAQIFFIFILPVFLIYFKLVPSFYFRFAFLLLGSLFIYGIIRHENWSYEDLGIRLDNIKMAFLPYLIFTICGVIFLFLIARIFRIEHDPDKIFYLRTFLFFLPISFFQEFAFRAFLIPELKKIHKNKYIVILINALLFSLIHIIYPDIDIGIPLTFLGGIGFAYLYLRYPNFLLISISHSILNLVALLLGFFVPIS